MDPCMYIFINKGLGMSPGKLAAQCAHAAVEAFIASCSTSELRVGENFPGTIYPNNLVEEWYKGGHYKKLVMQARDEMHLYTIERYLRDRGFETRLIIDEGMTEIAPHVATALGVVVVDKDDEHTAATFSRFRTYKEDKPKPEPKKKKKWWQTIPWFGS